MCITVFRLTVPRFLQRHQAAHVCPRRGRIMAEAVHCLYCFDVLASHLHRTSCPDPPFPADASFPLFVTWNKQNRSGHLDLRGCIGVPGTLPEAARHDLTRRVRACPGCLSPLPITSLKTYALNSALKDRRFSPIDARELPHLHCTVSLLTSFEVACSLDDWTIGPHGVMIDYVDPTNQVPRTTELSWLGHVRSRAPSRAAGPPRAPPQAHPAATAGAQCRLPSRRHPRAGLDQGGDRRLPRAQVGLHWPGGRPRQPRARQPHPSARRARVPPSRSRPHRQAALHPAAVRARSMASQWPRHRSAAPPAAPHRSARASAPASS